MQQLTLTIAEHLKEPIELTVHFEYQPEEKPVYHAYDGGYPGSPEYVMIYIVEYKGVDVTDLLVEVGYELENLEEQLLQHIQDASEPEYEPDDWYDPTDPRNNPM